MYLLFMGLANIETIEEKKMEIDMKCVADVRARPMPKGVKNPLNWGVGDRLRRLGEENNLTQTRIGELAGVSHNAISQIERAARSPRLDIVERLATALGVSPAWLAFGEQGHLRFRQRHPRPVLPSELPPVSPAIREPLRLCQGIGDRLRQARHARGLSTRALSEPAGVSHQTVLHIEDGETIPLLTSCERLAVALDVSPGWLAFGEGEGLEDPLEGERADPKVS